MSCHLSFETLKIFLLTTVSHRNNVDDINTYIHTFYNQTIMGCPHNPANGRGLKVNTAKHSSEKGEGGTHPPLSHYCA